jgi:hypothetical protein
MEDIKMTDNKENNESKYSTYHDRLRTLYSEILIEKLSTNNDLKLLSEDEIELLFNGLKGWFGTSTPDSQRVKKDLKQIITEQINTILKTESGGR